MEVWTGEREKIMAKKQSRKQRKEAVYSLVMLPIGAIIILLMMNGVTNLYLLGGILLGGVIIASWAQSYVPDMRRKENRNKNEYTGLPSQKTKTSAQNKTTTNKKNPSSKTPQKEHNLLRSEKEILTLPLDELNWREFERLCFLYYKAKGYKPRETSEGADGGVDLIIYNRHHQTDVAIQIKHYTNPVTVKHIRELDSAKKNHKCILAEFITTSTYTTAAAREASDRKIEYRDRMWVENKILKWRDEEIKKRKLA